MKNEAAFNIFEENVKRLSSDIRNELRVIQEQKNANKEKKDSKKSKIFLKEDFFETERAYETRILYKGRKQIKYALLIIEMHAMVEQFLEDLYEDVKHKKYVKDKDATKNKILDLQEQLSEDGYVFNGDLKRLTVLRNYLIHENLNFKKAVEYAQKAFSGDDSKIFYYKKEDIIKQMIWLVESVLINHKVQISN